MENFITRIHVNKIFKLTDLDISIADNEIRHLLITGKNGCGKTSLLNALADFLQVVKSDKTLSFLQFDKSIERLQKSLSKNADDASSLQMHSTLDYYKKEYNRVYGKLNVSFSDIVSLSKKVQDDDFILAFYSATGKTIVTIPKNPDKPNLSHSSNIKDSKINEFIKFLVDLKVQESLARNEGETDDADEIKAWFISFVELLRSIFDDNDLLLKFNYRDYSFKIVQDEHFFGFNELSDGYSAILDIVADLILKMQSQNSITRAYRRQGIVLVDEIETHLHMELQRHILPMLTRIFPNIQFIVSTHSPFILNSLNNAIAYDLEKKQKLEDLTEYSYQALAEGFFKVSANTSFLQSKLERFEVLSLKKNRDLADDDELNSLDKELSALDRNLAPDNII
jgi:predicted ATP-binding protein involved in virulence